MTRQYNTANIPARKDNRIIIHFDYDCFYASVVEAEDPSLKTLPLAIQQKQIIVTCNYEARRRGLRKLQLITEAKTVCPDVVIVLGEDLTRFRNASKDLYHFLRKYSWNDRVERLGFDEIWMDVTDIIDYNLGSINHNDLVNSFFQTLKDDPTQGFSFNATCFAGYAYPQNASTDATAYVESLALRLALGSHLAVHLRHLLEEQKGYTCTVGISTSRLLSKLVGNVNKPRGQTTLVPPYEADPTSHLQDHVQMFVDGHDIGNVPWIGFKSAQKLRYLVLQRPADFDTGLVYGGSKESVTVEMVRKVPELSPERLEKLLGGPGQPRGIGKRVWGLIHGVDDTEVGQARNVPRQISIEDSYVRLDTVKQLTEELISLSTRLIERMRIDLLDDGDVEPDKGNDLVSSNTANWLGRPQILRLTIRPRLPIGADGTRPRTFKRISRSGIMPSFIFNCNDNIDALAQRLVSDNLIPLFKKLHPEKSGWNLSLVNVAATDMIGTDARSKAAIGRNIQAMFNNQSIILRNFQTADYAMGPEGIDNEEPISEDVESANGENEDLPQAAKESDQADSAGFEENITLFNDDEDDESMGNDSEGEGSNVPGSQGFECLECGELVPEFARTAHIRFHLDTG